MSVEAPAAPSGTGAAAGFLRRNRIAIRLAAGVLVVLGLVTWAQRDQGGTGGSLDPENTGRSGARAVARVLRDQGVAVQVVRGRAALDGAHLDAATTVVTSNPDELGASTWKDLDARVRSAGAVLVVIGLEPVVADGLGLGSHDVAPGPDAGQVRADCSPDNGLMDGLTLATRQQWLAVKGDGCFGDASGRLLTIDRQQHRWVLSDPDPITNDQIARGDNAAFALRLLGQRARIVWYVAHADDTAASDAIGVSRLLPRWLIPSLWLLGVATLALLVLRSRRLGPLVVEPIPVTIKALESTTSLGRLYEQARDRTHAADLLVAGTQRRLGPLLGLAERVSTDELVRAVAARTSRPVAEIAALLPDRATLARSVRNDSDLVALAQNLHQLEEEVRTR